jgi:hypothetical protein
MLIFEVVAEAPRPQRSAILTSRITNEREISSASPRCEGRPMSALPGPDDAEEIADADLDALDAMAEALLDAIIQGGADEDVEGRAEPEASEAEGNSQPRRSG